MYYRPFNYRFDGAFARASKAWFVNDDGSIAEVVTDERRIMLRGHSQAPWIFMEGARQNFIVSPLDLEDGTAWDIPATGDSIPPIPPPDGWGGAVAEVQDFDAILQTFLVGSNAAFVTWSVYVLGSTGSNATLWINNGTPNTGTVTSTNQGIWTRATRKAVSLAAGGNKSAQLVVNDLSWARIACVEAGPAYAQNARFPSQPILETTTRAAESFTVGTIIPELLTANGGATGFRISFEPDFASGDVVSGDAFRIVLLDTGVAGTSIILWLEGTGGGAVRARYGYLTGAFAASGSLTFEAGQRLDFIVDFAGGFLVVQGATAGNGTFSNSTYALTVNAQVKLGGVTTTSAYGLISPLEFTFAGFSFGTIEQLTATSIKVTFEDYLGPVSVLQFDPNGPHDALNPANYIIGGSSGLPAVQYVQPGAVGSEVVLFFDATLTPGATVSIAPGDIVLAGIVPVSIEHGAPAFWDFFQLTGGVLDTVLELTVVGETGDGSLFTTWQWGGDPLLRPGVGGVEILDDNPERPWINYWFIPYETTVADMEDALAAVAGHLVRIKIPGSAHVFIASDEFEQMGAANGQFPPVFTLIAFGAEVNAVAQAQATFPRVDIANPQTPKDAPQGASLGTFQVTDTGDLANDHGRTYLRKRVFRRLSTMRAAFFHLKDYGLNPPSKKLFTPTSLRRLKNDVEMQIRQEPGVVGVRAAVTELRPGVASIKLRIQDDNGSFELEGALDFTAE